MPLAAGQTLTHYEILGPLGAGGMGEVYHARDTRLDREVAIKVLPEEMAEDEERLRRFEREAKTLASLNHTNVAGIHGVDKEDDLCFLALELVPGEDLATRLSRGPLPVDEAIDVCRQIAEGLEAAHEAGVVHRDLKPANVRVTRDGVVKLLDFGLAKPIHPTATKEGTTSAQSDSFLMTEEGIVLGTPTYMSPEQARGKPVDRRTDVWAFGCVLFECLAGRRAFGGETFSDVLASIVQGEADWSALPAGTPAHVTRLLRRCLDKDVRTRLRDVGEARITLSAEPEEPIAPALPESSNRRLVPGLALGALLASLPWGLAHLGSDEESTPDRTAARGPYDLAIERTEEFPLMSPDGRRLLFVSPDGLCVRDLAEPEPEVVFLPEEYVQAGCWSPDGEAVAFFHGDRLETLVLGSASSERRCSVPPGEREVIWGDDGSFLVEISGSTDNDGLFLLAPGAHEPEHLKWLDRPEQLSPDRMWPEFLPGAEEILVTVHESDGAWIQVASLRDKTLKRIARANSRSAYVAPGWLAWLDVGRLLVQPFDAETHELSGRPNELLRNVSGFYSRGDAHFSFSDQGTLLVRSPSEKTEIEWVARGGRSLGRVAEPDHYSSVQLDPRGERLAYSLEDRESGWVDLWVRDLDRGVSTRVTSHERWTGWPRWSPDGTRLAFAADWKGPPHVYLVDLDDREPVEIVPYDGTAHQMGSWTATGDAAIYVQRDSGSRNLWMVELDDLERRPLLESPFHTVEPSVSRDGMWIVYASHETGRYEVYVATFPAIRGRARVSTEGGRDPLWNEDGTEIFYRSTEGVFAASFDAASGKIGTPELVVPDWGGNLIDFSVSPDGQQFVVHRSGRDAQRPPDRLVTDWQRLLER